MTPLTPVQSSQIAAVGFDTVSSTLAVRFNGGGKTYLYRDVSPDLHKRFMASDSKGKFFASEIRGKFDFTAVETEDQKTTTA